MMEQEIYIFLPAAGRPTVKKIRKFTYQLLAIITSVAIVTLFSKETIGQICFIFLTWLLLCTSVIILVGTNVYVIDVRIHPTEEVLYFSYMNYKGQVRDKCIDIKRAKYSYKQRPTKSGGYELTIKGDDAKLQIGETRSESKNQANLFFNNDMDTMNRVIRQIKIT